MSSYSRLTKSFEEALRLPLTDGSQYILISDCHRGIGTNNDNFLKNQTLYFAALKHYYEQGYTYIEMGDGDELWENRDMAQITETYSNIFWLFSLFQKQNRLYMIYGNHDIVKKFPDFSSHYPDLQDTGFYSGIILEGENCPDLYLTHGHQGDLLNSSLWPLARFLVRYLWKPLEHFGVSDPTSAAKNYDAKLKTEKRLQHWAKQENHILIAGHTHRPVCHEENTMYYNTGSCVHPRCITCIEIKDKQLFLVKWSLASKNDMTLYIARDVLAGPISIETNSPDNRLSQ